MGATRGRLEAKLKADAAWTVSITTTAGGPTAVTVLASAAESYPTDLCSTLKTQLDAAAIGTWTVTPSFGESGTGKVTITCNQATYTLTWSVTNLRDALGFTASVTQSSSTQTGPNHAKGVWLPAPAPMWSAFGGGDAGNNISDTSHLLSPRGDVFTLTSQRRTENRLRWSHVAKSRVLISGESVTGESFQQFWRDCYLGELAYCDPGTKVRVIWDADVSATYTEYRLMGLESFAPPRTDDSWNGMYAIELPTLVKVP